MMGVTMRRREFITLLGGAAATWPLAARAQQPGRMPRIGALMGWAQDDPDGQARVRAFLQGLSELGWTEGRNVLIDYRWADLDPGRMRAFAAELVGLAPNVLLATATTSSQAFQQATRTIPIVFASLSDPIGSGLVSNLARPEGNLTGFTTFEYSLAGKWLGLLRETAPRITRAAIVFNPDSAPFAANYVKPAEEAARTLVVNLTAVAVRDAAEIERALVTIANEQAGGLIVVPDIFTVANRGLIAALAAKHRVPAIYPNSFFVTAGGLMSYGPDVIDVFRRSASYVDRILRGTKLADLPVQQPTKYQFLINLKTAKALGLEIPPGVLAIVDEVIE
jgi:putative ABC transport system substrate-binding protein